MSFAAVRSPPARSWSCSSSGHDGRPELFTRRDPNAIEFLERLKPPSLAHPFGTDENGRDLWARVVYGARPTLAAAVLLVATAAAIGSLAGRLVIGAAGRRRRRGG